MPRFLPKDFPWHFPKSKKEEQEYGRGKKDILICEKCGAFYWYKSWHHSLDDYPELSENKDVKFTLCPACKMIENGQYEGELILENVLEEKKEEIENLINNFGELAYQKDPMDRIISIEDIAKGMIRVLTTENQIAKRLAKKLKRTYKAKVKFIYSKKESTLRARVVFP
jgi:NMD protein affecting ribosome stability and mRNA decay